MSKFRMKLKLQGLELELEGNREDAPLLAQNFGRQFAGLLQPSAQIIEGEVEVTDRRPVVNEVHVPDTSVNHPKRGTRRKRAAAVQTGNNGDDESPLDWRHDPAKWGSPKQGWNTATKAIWLLHVASNETDHKELSSKRISSTFNKHFKQAGQILPFNVSRDLGKLKVGKDAPVSEDTTQTSSPWFLTEAGTRRGQSLVIEALGKSDVTGENGGS